MVAERTHVLAEHPALVSDDVLALLVLVVDLCGVLVMSEVDVGLPGVGVTDHATLVTVDEFVGFVHVCGLDQCLPEGVFVARHAQHHEVFGVGVGLGLPRLAELFGVQLCLLEEEIVLQLSVITAVAQHDLVGLLSVSHLGCSLASGAVLSIALLVIPVDLVFLGLIGFDEVEPVVHLIQQHLVRFDGSAIVSNFVLLGLACANGSQEAETTQTDVEDLPLDETLLSSIVIWPVSLVLVSIVLELLAGFRVDDSDHGDRVGDHHLHVRGRKLQHADEPGGIVEEWFAAPFVEFVEGHGALVGQKRVGTPTSGQLSLASADVPGVGDEVQGALELLHRLVLRPIHHFLKPLHDEVLDGRVSALGPPLGIQHAVARRQRRAHLVH
mmetsp:Transcript_34885/g.86574  ORF Transcript_34885/g.86574 Transcript_34885/m.86574 type:complete len:383 (-) Transcript_34885:5782-6930(-)